MSRCFFRDILVSRSGPARMTMILAIWLTLISSLLDPIHAIDTPRVLKAGYLTWLGPREPIFGYRPIKDGSIAYGACNNNNDDNEKQSLNCSVHLLSSGNGEEFTKKSCPVYYRAEENRKVIRRRGFELMPLYDQKILFAWLDHHRRYDAHEPYLVFRVIDTRDCSYVETKIAYGLGPYKFVVYKDTFDVFYRNSSLCGDKMCGQTHDVDGELINGPATSYLPAEFFKEKIYVCPVESGSSAMGHFTLSSKLRLISSRYGVVKELMNYPVRVVSLAFSCEESLFGFCWVEHHYPMHVNCRQYDSQGNLTIKTRIDPGYRRGAWMSMRNLKGGGLLLQTSVCNDDSWCYDNIDRLQFVAYRVGKNVGEEEVEKIKEIDNVIACKSNLTTDIDRRSNGNVCLTFACPGYMDDEGKDDASVRVESRCIVNSQ